MARREKRRKRANNVGLRVAGARQKSHTSICTFIYSMHTQNYRYTHMKMLQKIRAIKKIWPLLYRTAAATGTGSEIMAQVGTEKKGRRSLVE